MKKITGILEHRDIPSVTYWTQVELGRALGDQPVSAAALTESAFAVSFLEKFKAALGPEVDPTTEEEEDQRHAG